MATRPPLLHAAALVALTASFALAACGGGDDESGSDASGASTTAGTDETIDDATGETTGDTGEESATTESSDSGSDDPLFDDDLAQVCRETGQTRATAYTTSPGVHPVVGYSDDGGGAKYIGGTMFSLPDGWSPTFEEYASVELVMCIHQASATVNQVCEGYELDDGTQASLETHDMVYEVTLREATTAAVVDEQTFEVSGDECPMFASFSADDPDPKPYFPLIASEEEELFVKPYVDLA